ncbi:hypothetical protein [Plantactinospora sp. CA-290183]|uniref:hypothetical protein n=1 Tax=Plantactinospora sp. CA-290183 TaxID=3240006 RepID=UPI003D930E7B
MIHHRLFYPAYRLIRPLVLDRIFRRQVRTLRLDRVDRIVACDLFAIPLASRLARRYPSAKATTSLEFD